MAAEGVNARIEDRISRNYEYAGEVFDLESLKLLSEIADEKENDIKNVLKTKFNSFVFHGKVYGLKRKMKERKQVVEYLKNTLEILHFFKQILNVIAMSILPLSLILLTTFMLNGLSKIDTVSLFSSLGYIALAPVIIFFIYKCFV